MSTVRSLRYLKSKQIYEAELKKTQEEKINLANKYLELGILETDKQTIIPLLTNAVEYYQESMKGTQWFFPEAKWNVLEAYSHLLCHLPNKIEQDDMEIIVEYCNEMATLLDKIAEEKLTLTDEALYSYYVGTYHFVLAALYYEKNELASAQLSINESISCFDDTQCLIDHCRKEGLEYDESLLTANEISFDHSMSTGEIIMERVREELTISPSALFARPRSFDSNSSRSSTELDEFFESKRPCSPL